MTKAFCYNYNTDYQIVTWELLRCCTDVLCLAWVNTKFNQVNFYVQEIFNC